MNLIPDRKDAEFTQAYAEHYSAVFGALYKMTRDCDVAEELTQEVFIRFYNKMESAANVRGWLLVTAKYVAYEHHHRQDSRCDEVPIIEDFDTVPGEPSNADSADLRIIIKELLEAIEDPRDRTIFELVSMQKYTHEQAGRLVGLTKRQVKYRHACTVSQMVDSLKKKGITSLQELL